ncbi:MAG: pantoate--beta-alanine ligase [Elusimicrobia bacterium CG06_land_8_20_14_3_00_38_11]|nr:MAG: pantoate--beta-alanine ligase [Elusimicrobia bacterium CG06_land_8_20_14_3_00_38_11]
MKIIHNIKSIQNLMLKLKRHNKSIGFVPTMGALHQGHISLIRRARKENDIVAVSIFVNPAQFAPHEDLKKYPRPFEKDVNICKNENVDIIFAPKPKEMYPENYLTFINVNKLSDIMCGKYRYGHFMGVATIVAKLFNIVQPDKAYFGLKDYQQSVISKKMVTDLNLPIQIVTCPIVREKDGLALSSRNVYLSCGERKKALSLPRSLQTAENLIKYKSVKSAEKIISKMRKIISPNVDKIDYIDIRDAETLEEVKYIKKKVVIAVAVFVGKTRLIDNIVIEL